MTDNKVSEAYDMIDRYLRNNLMDDDYAEYSEALETVYTHPTPAPDVALVDALKGMMRPLAELAHNVNDASGFMSLGAVARHATGEVGPNYYGMAYTALEAAETALAPFTAAQQEDTSG